MMIPNNELQKWAPSIISAARYLGGEGEVEREVSISKEH
jgi:hypothetical protein